MDKKLVSKELLKIAKLLTAGVAPSDPKLIRDYKNGIGKMIKQATDLGQEARRISVLMPREWNDDDLLEDQNASIHYWTQNLEACLHKIESRIKELKY